MVKVMDSQSTVLVCSKPLDGGSKVHSTFHLSDVDQLSNKNF